MSRKSITYINGDRRVRDSKLHEEKYLKENMENEFRIREWLLAEAQGEEYTQDNKNRTGPREDNIQARGNSQPTTENSNGSSLVCRRIWHLSISARLPGFIGPFPPPLLIRLYAIPCIFYCFSAKSQYFSCFILVENVHNSTIDILLVYW